VNLQHRQVIDEDMCEAWGLGEESTGHVCEKAQEVWGLTRIAFETRGVW